MSTLHLVDIENLCGGDPSKIAHAFDEFLEYSGYAAGDILVIATSHFFLRSFAGDPRWAPFRFVPPRSGPNGADLALAEVLSEQPIAGRYDEIVLGSGDGGFTHVMSAAGRETRTVVVAVEGSMSRSLGLAVHEVRLIPRPLAAAIAVAA